MSCPTLNDLPSPPPDKTGWPWTEASSPLPAVMPDGRPWPRISIVTPSFNQGQYVEETIRSVLLQGYPNLEYIILDGGSTDGSVEIIRRYGRWLAYWASEPDRGQAHAINKGFLQASGMILGWLNSDDRLLPTALQSAATFFYSQPHVGVVYGDYNRIDENGKIVGNCQASNFDLARHIVHNLIPQPASFFSREVWQKVGPLNESFHYVLDYDLFVRAALQFQIKHLAVSLADVRFHHTSKSVGQTIRFTHETERFFNSFFSVAQLPAQIKMIEPQARGANYFVMGRLYLKDGQFREARRAFWQAWQIYPCHPNKLAILMFLVDTVLRTRLSLFLFKLALRIKHKSGCLDQETL